MMKAKRRLKNFNFEAEGAHVALVGKHQGGPANGYTTLITKSTAGIPETFVEKADMVKVTMTIQEFLRRFFGLYYEDAEILARILGYDTENDSEAESYEDYIQSKIDSVEIMKSLFKAEDMTKALSEVTEDQFVSLLKDQQMIENLMSSGVEKSQEGVSKQNVEKTKEDVTLMSDENKDMIQKSEVESMIEKAVGELKTQLEKANETIEAYKAKEKEQVAETRKAALKDAVKDDEKAAELFKSFESLSDEAFETTVATLKALTASADSSEMFVEKGVDTEVEQPAAKESVTAALLKKQFASN